MRGDAGASGLARTWGVETPETLETLSAPPVWRTIRFSVCGYGGVNVIRSATGYEVSEVSKVSGPGGADQVDTVKRTPARCPALPDPA
jgi:hypothetical protein